MPTETDSFRSVKNTSNSSRFDSLETANRVKRILGHTALICLCIVFVLPFVWALLASLKPSGSVLTPNMIPKDPTLENWVRVFKLLQIDRWIMNSLIFTTAAVFLTVLVDSLAGYALAKGDFRGQKGLYFLTVSMLIVPPQVILVPLFMEMAELNLINTYWAIMALYIANPFGAFMMRQFFITIPDELIDSAIMDGCNKLEIFFYILLPMAKPTIAALTIFTFVFSWNGLIWPLVVTQEASMFPVQVGIAQLTGSPYSSQWGLILAVAIIAMLPVLIIYLITQRTFMRGVTMMGAKR